jgi:DNA repair protein RadA/Sms
MIIAVLETRCHFAFGQRDTYLSVTGGFRLNEPAADLAVAAALASALTNVALPLHTVIFGEIGLTGEIRSVSHHAARLKEAHKLGFLHAFAPSVPKDKQGSALLEVHYAQSLQECLRALDMIPRRGKAAPSVPEDV